MYSLLGGQKGKQVMASESRAKPLRTTGQLALVKKSQPRGTINWATDIQTPVFDAGLLSFV